MSHSRFALGFTRNRKVFALSDAAFRLYVSAIDWSREQRTDGVLTEKDMPAIPRLPRSWRASAVELVGAGLWEAIEDGWRITEWCEPEETELSTKRAEAGRKGGLAKASKQRLASVATDVATGVASTGLPSGNATDPSLSPTPPLPNSTGLDLSDSESSPALSSSSEPVRLRARGERKASKPARWRRVPAEFEPTEEHRRIARERQLSFELELAKFRDHEFDKPKSDADATFRNWLRNASPARDFSKPPGFAQHEQTRRVLAGAPGFDDYEARKSAAEVERIRQRNALFGSVGQSLPKLREVPK